MSMLMCAKKYGQVALITVGVFGISTAFSQTSNAKYELGLNLGAYIYQGDLVPKRVGSFKTIKPGIGISFAKIFTPSFTVGAMFNLASLKGDETKYSNNSVDAYRAFRAFKFKSKVRELSIYAKWNILGASEYETKFEPYVFAGAGLAFIKVLRDYSGYDAAYFGESSDLSARLAQDVGVSARRIVPVFPAGVGVSYNLNENFALDLQTAYRFTGSDYIDGYSIAANPAKNDHYLSQTIGVRYKLGRKDKLGCPVLKY